MVPQIYLSFDMFYLSCLNQGFKILLILMFQVPLPQLKSYFTHIEKIQILGRSRITHTQKDVQCMQ